MEQVKRRHTNAYATKNSVYVCLCACTCIQAEEENMAYQYAHKHTRSSIALSSANKGNEHVAVTRINIVSHVRVLQSDV